MIILMNEMFVNNPMISLVHGGDDHHMMMSTLDHDCDDQLITLIHDSDDQLRIKCR